MGKKKDPGAALRAQAAANMAEARKRLDAVDLPDYEKQQAYINLMAEQVPEIAGILQAEQMDTPEDIQEDPRLAGLKMQALESLSERGKAGLSEEDKLKYEDARMAMAADAASQQSDIERRMAERGAGGSGQELAMRLAGQQGAAQRASEFGRGMAADALQAKMQSEQAAGQMAGQMSAADMANQRSNQQAKQAIAQFNAMNRQNIAQQNLAQRQQQANQRAALQQQKYGQLGGLEQQKFSNQMAKTGAVTGALTSQANMLNQQSAMMKPDRGIGGMIGTLAGAGIGAMSGAGPQGAAVGAQIGGSVGSQFADGGVVPAKEHYQADSGKFSGYGLSSGVAGMGPRIQLDQGIDAPPSQPLRATGESLRLRNEYDLKNKFGGDRLAMAQAGPNRTTGESWEALKGMFGGGNEDSAMQKVAAAKPDARDTGANMPAGESPAQETQDAAAKGAVKIIGKDKDKEPSTAMGIASAIAENLPQEKEAAGLAYSNVSAPQVNLVKDQVFGAPFQAADGGVPGYIAEDGDVVSVDGGFIFPGEEDEYAGDRVDARVNRGEMILNAEQQQRMLDVLRGEASPEVLHNGEDVIETPEEAQTKGFLKILEMIGKK